MTEETPPYHTDRDLLDRGPGWEKLTGSRPLAIHIAGEGKHETGGAWRMLVMFDDGTWVDVRTTGPIRPRRRRSALDVSEIRRLGEPAYWTVFLGVADPDSGNRVRVLERGARHDGEKP